MKVHLKVSQDFQNIKNYVAIAKIVPEIGVTLISKNLSGICSSICTQ